MGGMAQWRKANEPERQKAFTTEPTEGTEWENWRSSVSLGGLCELCGEGFLTSVVLALRHWAWPPQQSRILVGEFFVVMADVGAAVNVHRLFGNRNGDIGNVLQL